MEKLSFAGRGFIALPAHSLEEAKAILQDEPDIAIVVMDVVIEGENIGLDLVRFIRKELQNEKIRIVLRTGYPNSLPEKEITQHFAVDGCLLEEEFSKSQFEFILLGATQTYHQIITVTQYLQGMAGSIAHELRNPLPQVMQGVSVIKKELSPYREKFPEEDIEVIDDMADMSLSVCKRANMMIGMILQNIKDQKFNTDSFKTLSVTQVINTATEEFVFECKRSQQVIRLNSDEDFEFKGDETLLIYVLFNLIKNSLYFISVRPKLQIDIRLKKGAKVNTLYFKDNGPGIPQDKLPTIFDNFVTSGKKEGTGLGFPFCKRVMTAFGGDITCQSKVDEWTEFKLTFPKQAELAFMAN